MPNFRIKMGFGLHVGWAIEGAIGSVYKIDASYLSPNVNISARLEAATRQYGVPLLMTNELVHNMSKKVQKICREIDRVTVKGSVKPIGLFTVDLNIANIKP
jgi:class 3 adenylate cyclase